MLRPLLDRKNLNDPNTHHVEALHWVRFPTKLFDCQQRLTGNSGLAWHTDDSALRAKFEEFGQVEEAVRPYTSIKKLLIEHVTNQFHIDRRQGS